jgi:hypothetical protein
MIHYDAQVLNPLTGKKMLVAWQGPPDLCLPFGIAPHGTNQAKHLAQSSARCHHQWRNAVQRR